MKWFPWCLSAPSTRGGSDNLCVFLLHKLSHWICLTIFIYFILYLLLHLRLMLSLINEHAEACSYNPRYTYLYMISNVLHFPYTAGLILYFSTYGNSSSGRWYLYRNPFFIQLGNIGITMEHTYFRFSVSITEKKLLLYSVSEPEYKKTILPPASAYILKKGA